MQPLVIYHVYFSVNFRCLLIYTMIFSKLCHVVKPCIFVSFIIVDCFACPLIFPNTFWLCSCCPLCRLCRISDSLSYGLVYFCRPWRYCKCTEITGIRTRGKGSESSLMMGRRHVGMQVKTFCNIVVLHCICICFLLFLFGEFVITLPWSFS